ncbi:MAG TPA: metalloregulator ArsR/SmtB family transcription factor [Planctomycetota bacterium]|nr:metalloregulator ArsR/SmtB family transcription factor [Planctomycetota bacterium]
MNQLDQTLSALADPMRRSVIDLLRRKPRPASALADALRLSRPAMSRHLRVLRASGLVEEHHPADDARYRVYSLRPEPFANMRVWLNEVESFWSHQLNSLKEHIERSADQG